MKIRIITLLSFLLITVITGNAAIHFTEDFNTFTGYSYSDADFTLNGRVWRRTEVMAEFPENSRGGTGSAARINDDTSDACLIAPAVNTVGTVSFWHRELNTGGGTFKVQKSIDGGAYTDVDSHSFSGQTFTYYSFDVNDNQNNIRIKILSDDNTGHLIIDDMTITDFGGSPGPTNKPGIESIAHSVSPTNNQPVTVFVSAYDDVATLEEVNVIYSQNDWSSSSSISASLVEGKVFSATLPAFGAGTTIKYTASAKNSYTNYAYASVSNTFTVRSSDIIDGSYTCRVMSANTTSGNDQAYESPGIRIFQGLKPDIVGIQEFNYESGSLRDLVDTAFGTGYYYYCEGGSEQIPNGIISRWPITASGEWEDVEVSNRDFAWATIDIPGTKNLHVVSVHLLTAGAAVRNNEATVIKAQVQANFSTSDYVVVAGDMNTDNRSESCINTLKSIPLSDAHIPKDQNSDDDTNASRAKPYDWVLPNPTLNSRHVATIVEGHSFADGLVYDSRITSPYSMLPSPILSGDSGAANMQHMAVVKDFLISGSGTTTNFTPVLNYVNNQTAETGVPISFSIIATDADNDQITLTCSDASHFTSSPASGSITGEYSWTPTELDCGNHAILFTAESTDLYSRQMINITVIPEPFAFGILGFGVLILIRRK